jgi:hypothetical protein
MTDERHQGNRGTLPEIDKLLSFIADLLRKEPGLEHTCNPLLWGKVQEIWDAFTHGAPKFTVHLVGNQAPLTVTEQARLETSLTPYRNFTVRHHSLESIARLILEAQQPRIDALSAGQAYLAYQLRLPEVAGKDRGNIFGELYDEIFNDDIAAPRLLVPLEVSQPIEQMKRDLERAVRRGQAYDPAMLFLVDGAYHLLFAIAELCTAKDRPLAS